MKLRQARKIWKLRWTSPLNEPRGTTRDRARKVIHRILFNKEHKRLRQRTTLYNLTRLYVDRQGRCFSSIAENSLGRTILSPREVSATPPDNTTN